MTKREHAFQELWNTALVMGAQAAQNVYVSPMVVVQHENPLDDNSKVVYAETVDDGVCGFAWVNIKPANSAFAKWLVANGHARKDSYYGGVTVWISDYNQSMTRKYAHAAAFANVIKESGMKLRVYAESRMD